MPSFQLLPFMSYLLSTVFKDLHCVYLPYTTWAVTPQYSNFLQKPLVVFDNLGEELFFHTC